MQTDGISNRLIVCLRVSDTIKGITEGVDMSAKLDFCCLCNGWIGASEGKIRLGSDGEVEIVCDECYEAGTRKKSQSNSQTAVEVRNG